MKDLIDSISNARDSKSIDANMIPRATVYERGRNLVEVDSVPEFSMKNCCVDIMKMLIVSHVNYNKCNDSSCVDDAHADTNCLCIESILGSSDLGLGDISTSELNRGN